MARKGKMTEEEKKKLPEAFRKNFGRIRALTTEEARKMGEEGGQAFAERAKRTKELQEAMKGDMLESILMLLNAKMLPGISKIYEQFELPDEKGNNLMAVFMGQMKKAQSGDPTAAKFILEVAGLFTETKNVNLNTPADKRGLLFAPKDDAE